MRTSRPTTTSLLAAALALALPACSTGSGAGQSNPTVNHCAVHADCPGGTCDLAHRRCVATTNTEVFFSASPPNGRITAVAFPTITQPRSLRTGDVVDVALHAPHTVYGVVSTPDPSTPPGTPPGTSPGVPVLITATVQFAPAGVPDVITPAQANATMRLAPPLANDTSGYSYSVQVAEGLFDVVVQPAAELAGDVPPIFQSGFDVRSDSPVQRFDVIYPPSFTRWAGVITDHSGRPLTGLTVRAVDLDHAARVVSTVATGANVTGSFGVSLSPGAPDAWTLRITSNTSAQGWFTVDFPRAVLEASGYLPRDLRIELPDTAARWMVGSAVAPPVMGAPPGTPPPPPERCGGCVTVRASVEGNASNGMAVALRGAAVMLRAAVPDMPAGVSAWYEAHAATDAEGTFAVNVPPGDYDVTIVPGSSEFANAVRRGFRVRADLTTQAGQIFTLEPRIRLEGRVLAPQGVAVAAARVTAVPFADGYLHHPCLDDPDLHDLAPRASPVDSTTLADGTYRLDLDPGLYRVLVEPAAGSGFPATLGPALCVASRVRDHDIALDVPLEVRGTVRDAARHALPGATVEALVRVHEPGARGVAVRVGRSTADATGAYSLLLPGGLSP